MRRLEWFAIQPIRDDRLLVHRALDVPALVVVVVKRLEIDVACFGIGLNEARQLREWNSRPGLHRRPTLDAVVIDSVRYLREALQILEGEPHGFGDEPAHLESPLPAHGLIPDRDNFRNEVAR